MVSIVANFTEKGLEDLTSDVDQLVRKFRDLKKTADTLGTSNLTKVLVAQAKASQAAAKATAEQAKAEQQRQRTQQVSLKTAQQVARAELLKSKAQTESAKTTREIARAEQAQTKTAAEKLKLEQQQLKTTQQLSRAEQQAARTLQQKIAAGQAAKRTAQETTRSREQEARVTNIAAQRLKAYTDANLRLAQAAQLPLSSVKKLTRELGVTPQKAEQLVRRFRELQTNGASAAQTFKTLSRETGISSRQFTTLNRTLGVTDRQLQNLSAIGAATGLALAGALRSASSTYVEFQRNIQGAAVRAGQSLDEFAGVREEAARLGATTSQTATDISATTDQLARMGFTASQQEVALEGLVKGAEGAGESLQTVTNTAGRAINQFGLNASEAGNVTDILVTAANAADVSVSTLGESLKFVGPVANAANQSLEDTTFTLALLGNAGIRGGQAGRNLVSFLDRLKVASAANETELLGLVRGSERAATALSTLGSKVRDETTGELLPLRELIPLIQGDLRALQAQSQADFDIVSKALFGTEGGRVANIILNSTEEQLAQLEERFGTLEGASARSSRQLQQGLPGALLQLQSAVEGLQLRAFEEFAPLAETLVRSLKGLIDGFQSLDPRLQSFLIQSSTIGATLVVAIGALSAFQLAIRTLQPIQSAQAAVTQVQNLGFKAQAIASGVATAAQNTYAAATGKATAAQKAQISAFAQQAARAGLFAGAIAAVALAVGQYNEIQAATADTAQATESVDDAYQKLLETQARVTNNTREQLDLEDQKNAAAEEAAARNAQALQDSLGPISNVLDPIRQGFEFVRSSVTGLAADLLKLVSPFDAIDQKIDQLVDRMPGWATAGELVANRQTVAFGKLIGSAQTVEGKYQDIIQTLRNGGDVDPAVLNDLQAAINDTTIALEDSKPTSEEDIRIRDAQIRRLQAAKTALDEYSSATGDATDATDEFGDREEINPAEGLAAGYQDELKQIERDQAESQAKLSEQAGLGEAERQSRELSAQQTGLEQRRDAAKRYYENLQTLAASDPGNKELQDKLLDAEIEYFNAREELAKNSADQRQATEESAIEAVEDAIKKSEQTAEQSVVARESSLLKLEQQLRSQGESEVEIARQVGQQKLKDEEQNIRDQIALENQRIGSYLEGSDEQRDAIIAKANLENDLLRNQIDQEEQFRENQIEAIEAAADAQKSADDAAIASAETRLDGFKLIEQSLERQAELLAQQSELQGAIAGLRSAAAANDVADAESALDLSRQRTENEERLDEIRNELRDTSDDERRNELEKERKDILEQQRQIQGDIKNLGFQGRSEVEIERELIERTRERFELEKAQQEQRQKVERLSLEFEIKKNQIAAQRIVTEEQIALARLIGQRQALQAEIEIARVRGDDAAVRAGQDALGVLALQIQGQQQLVGLAQENLKLEQENAEAQRAQLAATQQQEDVALAQQQESTARSLDSDLQSDASQRLADDTSKRADEEEREAQALAENLESLVQTDEELQSIVDKTAVAADESQRLAEQAERYLAALQAAPQAVPGQIPGFRSGGVTPGGAAVVGEAGPELGFYPKGTRIVSNAQAKRWVQESASINPAAYSGFLRSSVMSRSSTNSIKSASSDRELISAMKTLSQQLSRVQSGQSVGVQNNRFSVSRETLKSALRDMEERLSGQVASDFKRRFNLS